VLRNPNLRTPAAKQGMILVVAVLVAATIGAVFALGRGVGGESAEAAFTAAGVVTSDDGDALPGGGSFDDFAKCLEEQGVTPPEPGTRGQRPDDDALRSAFEACRAYAPGPRGAHGMLGPPDGDGATPSVPGLPPDDSGDLDSDTPTL
jgi:hypothetical protein